MFNAIRCCAPVAALLTSTMLFATGASAGLVDLVSDIVGVNAIQTVPGQPDQPESWSMRLYAVLDSGTDTLEQMYGTAAHPILISTSAQFYQNTFGGPTSLDIDPADFVALPDLQWDSWITLGADSMFDNDLQVSGTSFAAFNTGSALYAPAGVWSVPSGSAQSSPSFINGQWRVLIGQFSFIGSLDSTLHVQLNLSGTDAGGDWSAGGNWTFGSVPAPGALPLAFLACVGMGRRRARPTALR